MSKVKTAWFCAHCGHKSPKWLGQCPQCKEWNCLNEERLEQSSPSASPRKRLASKAVAIDKVELSENPRLNCGLKEFDRLLGGGIVEGAFMLLGGEPGIGKSTWLLQVAASLAQKNHLILYVCGEESNAQTSMRAKRLNISSEKLFVYSETNTSLIEEQILDLKPKLVIIDSIQMLFKEDIPSAPGSVSQVRENAAALMQLAKRENICIFLIGHVTKSGEIAGPRVLEHLVDTVLYFEGEKQQNLRILRVVKNRFGPSDEIAIFQMRSQGLFEIPNPSEIFLQERLKGQSGSVIVASMEGTRPLMVELQALVSNTVFPAPSRKCTGLDQNRLALLLAVLEKRLSYQMFRYDVFVSIAGGLKIYEPSIDLGIVLALASSYLNKKIDPQTTLIGEVGLAGEVRAVNRIETRIKEAINMGFRCCVIPRRNLKGLEEFQNQIKICSVDRVEEAIETLIQ